MHFTVHPKERSYFAILCIVSVFFYAPILLFLPTVWAVISASPVTLAVLLVFPIYLLLQYVLLAGFIKGNAVKVNERQLPEAYAILKSHSELLQLPRVPEMYVMHGSGVLNAFAVRLARRNYVLLHAEVLELAYQEGEEALSFIIGHELGHIKQNHVSIFKSIFTLPGKFIPFLGLAYSRACEYTCDNIGFHLSPNGAAKGLLILSVGKKLYKKIDAGQLLFDYETETGFDVSVAEFFSTHPMLMRRLAEVNRLKREYAIKDDEVFVSPQVNMDDFRQKEL